MEESTAGLEAVGGQPSPGSDIQITRGGTEPSREQPATEPSETTPQGTQEKGTTSQGTQEQTEDTFFDPKDIQDKPELMAAYKSMLKNYTQKTQAIAKDRQKIEAYDNFLRDPDTQLEAMARQRGYQLTRQDQRQATQSNEPWEPKSWDEVMDRAKTIAKQEMMEEFKPVLQQVQTLRRNNLESYLDSNAPDWRQYEDDMMSKLREHPSLVNDPISLYKLSVPAEVLESRATQAAIKKMQSKSASAQVSGTSTTKQKSSPIPDRPLTFEEAVDFARKELESQGIRPG